MVPALSAIIALGNAAARPLAPIRRVVAIWKRSELSGHVTGSVCCTAWQAHRASRSQWMLWESSESNLHQTTRVSVIRFVDQLSATASPGVGQLAEKTLECRGIQRLAVSRIYDTEEEMFLFPPVSTSTTPESANSTTKSSSQNVGTNISAPT